jgi:aconitate hydratase
VQYVDHNLLQADERNAEDHLFLRSAARRFGLWFPNRVTASPIPRTCSASASPAKRCWARTRIPARCRIAGHAGHRRRGLEVALAIAGKPLHIQVPQIWGAADRELPPWCSAKDVILEMLRRHGVTGGRNRSVEYHGPGLDHLSRRTARQHGCRAGRDHHSLSRDEAVRAGAEIALVSGSIGRP